MRRKSEGVANADELVPELVRRVERHDPEKVIALLEPFVREARRNRILDVLSQRLESVAVLFDSPYDPHNGAAVLRSCEAFGVQALHVIESDKPFLAATSVARGAEKWVDIVRHSSVADAVALAKARGFELVGTHPEGELGPEALAGIPRLGLVLGSEREGIAKELSASCTKRVRVPMRGFVESLNVSVTAAILLSAATRDRKGDLSPSELRRLYARGLYFSVDRPRELLGDPV
jgi:tRNA (guanosine-2'-O-)-methyltransferase